MAPTASAADHAQASPDGPSEPDGQTQADRRDDSPLPRWLVLLRQAAAGVSDLASAHARLLGAELKLARAAAHLAMFAALAATVFAVALGLALLALLGHLLAQWYGSWAWSLLTICGLLALGLTGSIFTFRHCLHLLSLPESRAHWRALVDDALHAGKHDDDADPPQG
ncbi:ABC transporter ATP-binding protein [Oleiagrimonas sp. C23AA]|uniref:ABC transporter ATP-binding protein n=1 Tax=Oleiagrimonas sp. C23AA TaxID=2719047 RepID=UPI001421E2DE|nr:ABC transporter ATP-binding protein [Oleiagrimonas sp. C23AA]NII10626.1 ABC transporter ATP-binding protein [Oleiagrimonas sp. C23AA]